MLYNKLNGVEMYTFTSAHQFKKDLKLTKRQPHFQLQKLEQVLSQLQLNLELPARNRLHKLTGNFLGCYECHVQPNVLLIFEVDFTTRVIYLLRIGSHSELF